MLASVALPHGTMTFDSTPETTSPSRARVWVVDDSPTEREFARRFLAQTHEVQAFEDGSVVIELIAGGVRPDVIVLDWHMPTISGIEICRFLRQTHDAASLPILVLTASSNQEDLLEMRSLNHRESLHGSTSWAMQATQSPCLTIDGARPAISIPASCANTATGARSGRSKK